MFSWKKVAKATLGFILFIIVVCVMTLPLVEGVVVPHWLEMISVALWIIVLIITLIVIWFAFYSTTRY